MKPADVKPTVLFAAALLFASCTALASTERASFTVTSDPGVEIAVREVVDPTVPPVGHPVILLHGARVPGVPSFDLEVTGGSLAADLAASGLAVYIVDLRGYGASTRPAAMNAPRHPAEPLVRTGAAVRDLAAAVDAVLTRSGAEQVAILGWATGGHWAGAYAALVPERVSKLVLYNALYGYTSDHPTIGRGSRVADPNDPERFNIERFQNYRLNAADSLLPGWDRSIPIDDKAAWRAPAVAEAYVEAALDSDPTSEQRDPPSFRAPSGAMADSFLLATGAALWDARLIAADVLVVRSEIDFWSRPEDVTLLSAHLGARDRGQLRVVEIPQATHFVHLDRAERGRDAFLQAVTTFLVE
ncbi:alpha/beta fold hydrolase [Algihabitans albus]|uniref:alpha/beta fold hydrolase n=1 Tax=Algihabitans albus TaxID=2164067 RepID=UPI000E5D3666|nr:alpha/beta fold hydrolase [Algihabitans albus]